MFSTVTGQTVPAVTTAQMREIDRRAIEGVGPNLYQMMENAGRSLAGVVMNRIPGGATVGPVLILAGSGGNGGGGMCAGRHLANHGVQTRVALAAVPPEDSVPGQQLELYRRAGGEVVALDLAFEPDRTVASDWRPVLIVDALIGYSLSHPVEGTMADALRNAERLGAPIVSLDVPSGVDATTGEIRGCAIVPDVTLTLALPKHGLACAETGELLLADLGIPAEVFIAAGIDYTNPFGTDFVVRILSGRARPRRS